MADYRSGIEPGTLRGFCLSYDGSLLFDTSRFIEMFSASTKQLHFTFISNFQMFFFPITGEMMSNAPQHTPRTTKLRVLLTS